MTVNDVNCHALVDSGSAATIISSKVFKKIGIDSSVLKHSSNTLTAANGGDIKVEGKLRVPFEIDNQQFEYEILVADLDGIQAVLGNDFLEDFDVSVKFGKACMQIGKHKIKLVRQDSNAMARIKVSNSVIIESGSESVIQGYIDGHFKTPEGIMEPYKLITQKGLLMAKSVVSPDSENVAISVINISDQNVRLQRNTTVASLQTIQSIENISSCDDIKGNLKEQVLPKHLQPLLDATSDTLTLEQSKQLKGLLVEFQDIFTDDTGQVGQTGLVEHTIDVDGSKPIKIPPRRLPIAQKDIVDKELGKMLDQNVIEPSTSAWSSPIVQVTKADGSIRFCIDFRKVNSVTKKDAYPLPNIGDALDTLSGSRYFCTLDMASGYWQIKMHEDSKKYTAFSTHRGLYQFKVMPFGLCNAPASFERLIERVLHGLQWQKCLCYLDDIIVFGKTFEETLENLKEVFIRFREANLKLKPKKCHLFQTEVKYLGHIVSENGISCDEQKIKVIQDWPAPRNKTEVQRLLGFLNYYRKFIPNFSIIAFPITQLTQKTKKFVWSEESLKDY